MGPKGPPLGIGRRPNTALADSRSADIRRFLAICRCRWSGRTNIYAFMFGAIAGISAGNSLLFAKGAAEVIKASIQSGSVGLLLQPTALVMVGGMAGKR